MTDAAKTDCAAELPALPDISFDHTGFITPDMETSVRFWQDVLGFEAQPIGVRHQEWLGGFMGVEGAQARLVHLFGHGTHLEFIELKAPKDSPSGTRASQGNVAHVCLMTSDVDALRARILAGGGREQGRMVAITEGIAKGRRGLYMMDPHGVLIEIVEKPRG
ncbi:VOC family protein [Paracoccus saliphilus]|uniref:Catechol 2,3-dioxygenase n=1 Tax=Paracoccus saliphilus TaxID=405559 RepID=A0AA45W2K3_9RHOB|nr:VOC family protein [Paracoccus saliphilus]WCR01474.1 VOC family protein [Paracoccus saliphilus]SIS69000.1 Catechol 2,3-dioxygenase [Paracoccus saliphilus]